jgi:16S rRNA pseudouridine516 synthase
VQRLLGGVVLDDDPEPVRAEGCERTGERALRLTLVQGKYHQVKRMVAAVGNHCTGLHRSRFGALSIAPDLQPGQWAWVDGLAAILGQTQTQSAPGRPKPTGDPSGGSERSERGGPVRPR